MARPQRLERLPPFSADPLKQELDATAINAITLHDEANQWISNQLGVRSLCRRVHNVCSRLRSSQFMSNEQ